MTYFDVCLENGETLSYDDERDDDTDDNTDDDDADDDANDADDADDDDADDDTYLISDLYIVFSVSTCLDVQG